jgi:hypothetical protein
MTPEQQYQFVVDFNWDDSLDPILQILDSRECVFETALLVFWRLEGPWVITGQLPNHPHSNLIDVLKHDLLSGRYPRGLIRFNPIETEGLSRTQVYQLKKAGLPKALLGIE